MASKNATKAQLIETLETREAQLESMALSRTDLLERLAELELGLEDIGWIRESHYEELALSRDGIKRIATLARLAFLKHPLIKRGVLTQSHYVFGQGVEFKANDPDVDEVINDFLEDTGNMKVLTSHDAMVDKENTLQIEGNLFFVLFSDVDTGRTRIRSIIPSQISRIIFDPEDSSQPMLYLREWTQDVFSTATGESRSERRKRWYPDIDWAGDLPSSIGGVDVAEEKVYHIKAGGLGDMSFGVPEVYAALDWARAYRQFLENWSTIQQALARFAARLTTQGGSRGVQNAKARLATTQTQSTMDTNPPPVAGSTFIGPAGVGYEPIRTAGATTGPEEGRRLLLMVSSAVGLPETYFGDLSQGNHATAKTMDRPTELKMTDRQEMWKRIFRRLFRLVITNSILAPNGKLKGKIDGEEYGQNIIVLDGDEDRSAEVSIDFPPILEHDIKEIVDAVVAAGAAKGLPPRVVTALLLSAFDVENPEEILDEMFPPDEEDRNIMDPPGPKPEPGEFGGPPLPPGDDPQAPPGPLALAQAAQQVRQARESILEAVRR